MSSDNKKTTNQAELDTLLRQKQEIEAKLREVAEKKLNNDPTQNPEATQNATASQNSKSDLNETLSHLDDSNPIHQTLLDTVKGTLIDVFKTFTFTTVEVEAIQTNSRERHLEHNAYFYIHANKMNGFLALGFTSESMMKTVQRVLGDDNQTQQDAIDCTQEISNILYGGLKKQLQFTGYTFGLASYNYKTFKNDEPLIKEDVRYGYLFKIHSDLGPITLSLLYDTVEMFYEKIENEKLDKASKVNSTFVPGFAPIKFIDIVANKEIDFDVYLHLPVNKKNILYKRAGSKIEEKVFQRFQNYKIDQFYIREEDQSKFIDYVAKTTAKIVGNKKISDPARAQKLQESAKQIIGGFFDDPENSQTYLKHAQEVVPEMVSQLLDDEDPLKNLISKLSNSLTSTESHATNVQAFATIIAMTLGHTSPKSLVAIATGSLFHDIGFSQIPAHLHHKQQHEVSEEEWALIKKHPQAGVDILSKSMSAFPEEAKMIIQQHHEHYDGSGYPRRLKGFQTYELAKIVAIANDFDGRLRRAPTNTEPATIVKDMWIDLSEGERIKHDPKLFKKIFLVLTPQVFT